MSFYHDHMKLYDACSIVYCAGVLETTKHIHYDAEIAMVLEGSVEITIEQRSCLISRGGLFYVDPLSSHAYKAVGTYATMLFLGISRRLIANLFPDGQKISFILEDMKEDTEITKRLRTLLLASYHNHIAENTKFSCYNHAIAAYLLVVLHRHFEIVNPQHGIEDSDNTERNQKIEAYISANFDHALTLNMLAEHVHLSLYYTAHYFKRMFNTTFKQYLNTMRIIKAKYLLQDDHLSVTEIALNCGFDSSSSFSRVFKDKEGMTPSKYRSLRRVSKANKDSIVGMYNTPTGLYIAFHAEQHKQILKAALTRFEISQEEFNVFIYRPTAMQ